MRIFIDLLFVLAAAVLVNDAAANGSQSYLGQLAHAAQGWIHVHIPGLI